MLVYYCSPPLRRNNDDSGDFVSNGKHLVTYSNADMNKFPTRQDFSGTAVGTFGGNNADRKLCSWEGIAPKKGTTLPSSHTIS